VVEGRCVGAPAGAIGSAVLLLCRPGGYLCAPMSDHRARPVSTHASHSSLPSLPPCCPVCSPVCSPLCYSPCSWRLTWCSWLRSFPSSSVWSRARTASSRYHMHGGGATHTGGGTTHRQDPGSFSLSFTLAPPFHLRAPVHLNAAPVFDTRALPPSGVCVCSNVGTLPVCVWPRRSSWMCPW
jgi:hypothetical protein